MISIMGLAQARTATPLQVVVDTGVTQPAQPYFEVLPQLQQPTQQKQSPTLSATALATSEPTTMTPGVVTSHPFKGHGLSHPLFVIGLDTTSQRWLAENIAYLKAHQAIGIVVGATSPAKLKALSLAHPELTFIPASTQGLPAIIGTGHYPVLIQQGWVSQ